MKHLLLTTIAALVLVGCGKTESSKSIELTSVTETNRPLQSLSPKALAPVPSFEPLLNSTNELVVKDFQGTSEDNLKIEAVDSPESTTKEDFNLMTEFDNKGYESKKRIRRIKRKIGIDKKTNEAVLRIIGNYVELNNGVVIINNIKTKQHEAYIMPPVTLEKKENDDAELRYLKQQSKIYDKEKKLAGYLIHERQWRKVEQSERKLSKAQRVGAYASFIPRASPWEIKNYMTNFDGDEVLKLFLNDVVTYTGVFPWVVTPQKDKEIKNVKSNDPFMQRKILTGNATTKETRKFLIGKTKNEIISIFGYPQSMSDSRLIYKDRKFYEVETNLFHDQIFVSFEVKEDNTESLCTRIIFYRSIE